ncbi:bifunctional DNA primase/polymerase [Nocardiopsis sp. CNT-189]|uniref:bifunctional DNA primase/polymerase n=1 Tax=Nocardiopsis oceanisediminis TaxID=2816862 RepID=UPI003B2D93B9
MTTHTISSCALAAAHRGWPVFPLRAHGKQPARRFTCWERHATIDPGRIRAHWEVHPAHNYGITCGPAGLVVIDLDVPKDGQEPPPEWARPGITDGADVLATLAEQHGAAIELDTFTVRTRTGGTHLYYRCPEGTRYRNTTGASGKGLGWLIDTRAMGGYVVGPGSYVADDDGAGTYEVINNAPPAVLPAWLAALLPKWEPRRISAGQVHQMLDRRRDTSAYAHAALRGEVQRVLDSRPGSRNHALNTAAFALGTLIGAGILPKHLAEDALTHAALHVGLGEAETEATVHSGVQAGIRAPRGSAA